MGIMDGGSQHVEDQYPDLFGVPGNPAASQPHTDFTNGENSGRPGAQGGGLDLGEANRERELTQRNRGQGYHQFNAEALGGANGTANDLAAHYSQQGAAAQGRQGAQITNQYNGLDRMQNAAMGNAPSQAGIQMQQGLDQSLAGQIAAANSTRGGGANMALAQRNAASGGYQMQNSIAGQQAALRAQEMAQARGAYMQGSNDLRGSNQAAYGQDQQSAFQQAGLNQGQMAQNDSFQMQNEGLGLQALQGQQSSDTAKYGADRGVAIANSQQAASNTNAGISAGAATLGAIGLMASDARLKTDVSTDGARTKQVLPGELSMARTGTRGGVTQLASDERLKASEPGGLARSEADAFLESLHPSSYRYKDSADEPGMGSGGGRYLGVMAQDVERGPTGSTLVKDTPRGKMLDVPANLSAALGGIGRLHERIAELEAMKGKK